MCGIAGFAANPLPPTAPDCVRAMLQTLARRGPDAEGLHQWPTAVLGHRRLAVFDLSQAGRQPMLSESGDVGVSFNGAIYNFPELRRELEAAGHRFRSRADTEILVEGYRAWGIDRLVARLRGMFAFALWDHPRRTLFLVRDRLGVKPLVFAVHKGGIAFASTVRALRQAGVVSEIDPMAVLEFLEFGYVTDQRCIFAGAQKVPAATIVEWRDATLSRRSYWSLPRVNPDLRIRFEEAVEETERLLLEAVRLRLFADVPAGVLLSGGIDSSLVCWAMSRLNANLQTFTVGTPGDACDETGDARHTARLLGISHEMIPLSSSEPPSLDELTSAYAEPFSCSSALAMLKVSAAIKPRITVLLTGDGGDDVFLGYPFHRHFWMAQRLARALPECAARAWPHLRPLAGALPFLRRPKHFLDYSTGGLGAATRMHDGLPYYRRWNILGDRLASLSLAQRQIPLSFASARQVLQDFLDYEQKTTFAGEFMTKVDGATMYHALEARAPFLDHTLWDFAAPLPFSVRLHGGQLKAILREIVRRGISPAVARRPKQGFTIPVESWLATRWRGLLEETLRDSYLQREGWLRGPGLAQALRQAFQNGRAPVQLWHLLVLERWMRQLRSPAP
jgi:asparagine synthase (glutamine-hydrolysing)